MLPPNLPPAPMGGLPLAAMLARSGTSSPLPPTLANTPATPPMGNPSAPSNVPMPPASMPQQNAAALIALQGQQPQLPPNYEAEPQPNGSILLVEVDPQTGHKNVVKVISKPKRFQPQNPQNPSGAGTQ